MGSYQSAFNYHRDAYNIAIYGSLSAYLISSVIAAACLIFMWLQDKLRNYSLLLIVVGTLGYSIANSIKFT